MNKVIKDGLLVGAGGFLGTILREGAHTLVHQLTAPALSATPLYLLTVNTLGALVLGFLVGSATRFSARTRTIFGTGMCGSFTTYGSLATMMLLPAKSGGTHGLWVFYLLWAAVILVVGFAAAFAGWRLGAARQERLGAMTEAQEVEELEEFVEDPYREGGQQ
ncbi:hypothetical protein BSR29_07525 [Boudabousia liubingyangii]|uniref:Fluoride-specific ion channel FluC n=1 Tax=Boudabousia liubingyangii TaxID=1921764 RepID=A0A1Q5PKC3_9ACTO|nr:CrcB family protein [Boudabousia liubingyangii]OKL46657.1 hypothetical protein BSR29_07525 [Boudabousia liubingyangii]